MSKLLQFTTYGIKNIKKPITINFANQTINDGVKSFNNVKGIFGYNGAGKTALMTSVLLYRNIVSDGSYLLQKSNNDVLAKLINFDINEFYFEAIFSFKVTSAIKHCLKVAYNNVTNMYFIVEEKIELLNGRTINDKYKTLFEKKDNTISVININDSSDSLINASKTDLTSKSFIYSGILAHINEFTAKDGKYDYNSQKILDTAIDSLYASIYIIQVFLSSSDIHEENSNLAKIYRNLIKGIEYIPSLSTIDDDEVISTSYLPVYKKNNKNLEKFIRLFKPDLKEIELDIKQDNDKYHIRKIFIYSDNCRISLEYESTGIKQLVKLFSYLFDCANGGTVFIDEIDANINAVYFEKMISFYQQYGKGQLCFTSHNINTMKTLKKQGKAIVAIGYDNNVDIWVGKGNKSPINEYVDGYFPHSPMNIEDFDFISIFFGE